MNSKKQKRSGGRQELFRKTERNEASLEKTKNERFRKTEQSGSSLKTAGNAKEHEKVLFEKPGNFLYPIPAVMVSCGTMEKPNIITIAWTGTICSDPPMVSISVRPQRYSYDIIKDSGEFVINLTTAGLLKACDYCGVKSGRDVDKFAETGLTPAESHTVACPSIEESPVSIECKVKDVIPLGTHDMFLAEVTGVTVDSAYIDDGGKFQMNQTGLTVYSHGKYLSLGRTLGKFGFSVKKTRHKRRS